jgi:hypothetical protein
MELKQFDLGTADMSSDMACGVLATLIIPEEIDDETADIIDELYPKTDVGTKFVFINDQRSLLHPGDSLCDLVFPDTTAPLYMAMRIPSKPAIRAVTIALTHEHVVAVRPFHVVDTDLINCLKKMMNVTKTTPPLRLYKKEHGLRSYLTSLRVVIHSDSWISQ